MFRPKLSTKSAFSYAASRGSDRHYKTLGRRGPSAADFSENSSGSSVTALRRENGTVDDHSEHDVSGLRRTNMEPRMDAGEGGFRPEDGQ